MRAGDTQALALLAINVATPTLPSPVWNWNETADSLWAGFVVNVVT